MGTDRTVTALARNVSRAECELRNQVAGELALRWTVVVASYDSP